MELFRHPKTKEFVPLKVIKATLTKEEYKNFKKEYGLGFWTQLGRILFSSSDNPDNTDTMSDDPRM